MFPAGRRGRAGSTALKVAGIGCGVIVLALVGSIVWMGVMLSHTPALQTLPQCRSQMQEIQAALDRYHIANGRYPSSLRALVPDYLATSKVFHCPADPDPARLISYTYRMPAEDAPGKTIILTCTHHRLANGAEIREMIRVDGRFAPAR